MVSVSRRRFSTRTMRRLMASAQTSPISAARLSGRRGHIGAASPDQSGCRYERRKPRRRPDARVALQMTFGQLGKFAVKAGGRSSIISRICSSTTGKLSTQPFGRGRDGAFSADGLGNRAVALGQNTVIFPDSGKEFLALERLGAVRWAAARLSACCSSRSRLKSSARIGSLERFMRHRTGIDISHCRNKL